MGHRPDRNKGIRRPAQPKPLGPVDNLPERARRHLAVLAAQGVVLSSVARVAGVDPSTVWYLTAGHGCYPATARKMLAVRAEQCRLRYVEFTCPACGAKRQRIPSDPRKYCSLPCRDAAQRGTPRPRLWATPKRYTDESIFAMLRQAAEGGRLSVILYERWRGPQGGPSAALIVRRFGSWSVACQAAGISPRRTYRQSYQRRWTEDDLLQYVRLAAHNGHLTWADAGAWLATLPGAPSIGTIRLRFGTWTAARAKAFG